MLQKRNENETIFLRKDFSIHQSKIDQQETTFVIIKGNRYMYTAVHS